MESDPYQLTNLADDPSRKKLTRKLRKRLRGGRFLRRRRFGSFLFEDENVLVFEDVKPSDQGTIPPELLLISLCAGLLEVLNHNALQRVIAF